MGVPRITVTVRTGTNPPTPLQFQGSFPWLRAAMTPQEATAYQKYQISSETWGLGQLINEFSPKINQLVSALNICYSSDTLPSIFSPRHYLFGLQMCQSWLYSRKQDRPGPHCAAIPTAGYDFPHFTREETEARRS